MHYKAGNQSKQAAYGQNSQKGERKTLGQKNPSGDSQRHKITIKSPQAQKNVTAHNTFRNPSLRS